MSAQSILSKKRYSEVKSMLSSYVSADDLDTVMSNFCVIMNFDPSASTYNQDKKDQILKSRKKRAEELGVSTYVTGGSKSYYERRKQSHAINT